MNYQDYLLLLAQLNQNNRAKLLILGKEVIIDASSQMVWKISTKLPSFAATEVGRVLNLTYGGYIKTENHESLFIQEVRPISKYSQFRKLFQAYMLDSEALSH